MEQHKWQKRRPWPDDLTWPCTIDPAGAAGPTKSQAAGRAWRRTSKGLYVPAGVDAARSEQRIIEAYAAAPGHAQLSGWAACRVYGANFHDGFDRGFRPLRVPLLIGPRGWANQPPGVRNLRSEPDPEPQQRGGMSVVRPELATFDSMRMAGSLREAVVELEKSLIGGVVTRDSMEAFVRLHPGRSGVCLAREALTLTRDGARSPAEVRLRLVAELDAELPALLVNRTVLDEVGSRVGEVDLLEPEAGLVIEFDGADHRDAATQSRDVVKQARLRDLGLEVERVTGQQVGRPELVARLVRARQRAVANPIPRRWGLALPS